MIPLKLCGCSMCELSLHSPQCVHWHLRAMKTQAELQENMDVPPESSCQSSCCDVDKRQSVVMSIPTIHRIIITALWDHLQSNLISCYHLPVNLCVCMRKALHPFPFEYTSNGICRIINSFT